MKENNVIELKTLKEVFIELCYRFESTENLQAMETLQNYFNDFDFGFDKNDVDEINSYINDVIIVLE